MSSATGRVVRADARVVQVALGGTVRAFAPRGKLFETLDPETKNPIATGDLVRVSLAGDPPHVEEVLARRNYLPRVASSHDPRQQVLFANVDQLLVVGSLAQPRFSSNRTDRILAACTYYEIPAALVLNKIDLDRHGEVGEIRTTYERAGVEVLVTGALDGTGVEELARRLRARTTVLYGASGAGKSTLINAIQPDLDLRTGAVSSYWRSGKHTTTASQMIRLDDPSGDEKEDEETWIVDTPGIRVFRLYGVNKAELRDLFPEFEPFQPECRFPDCSHDHEPDCAVFAAVERGDLAPTRYASYVEILDELAPPPEDHSPVAPPPG